jgi:transposase-like protein
MKNKVNWKKELPTLRKYLEEDKMTYKEVAKKFNTTEMQVAQACRTYNVTYVSSRSHRWTQDEITNLKKYLEEGLTYNEISEKMGMSRSVISAFTVRNKFNYKNTTRRIDYKSLNDNIELVNRVKYLVNHGVSKIDIKVELNITDKEIESIIETNNIVAPTFLDLVSRGIYNGRETGLTKDTLYDEVVNNKLSYKEIGQEYGIPPREIRSWVRALDIKSPIFISYAENKRSILLNQLHREPTKEEMIRALHLT